MKILFAVNNDNVSDAIVKKYQKDYREILSYKNVYYFNAILRELQKDKTYDRIVISEDLEPFANNNYNSIDKFLFEKYSNISEEAKKVNNNKIEIILICADRRKKTDDMILKVFNIGIYNAIIGQERSIDEICRLINNPRDKKDAKLYYNVQENELGEANTEDSVSEAEVQNILAHYKRLGKNEDKYLDSFNNIVGQYTDKQLKIIIKYLPIHVKAVLEEKSPKYQQLVVTPVLGGLDAKKKTANYKEKVQAKEIKVEPKENSEINQLVKQRDIKTVVIPSNISSKKIQKVAVPKIEEQENNKQTDETLPIEVLSVQEEKEIKEQETEPVKKGRGRPRKNPIQENIEQKPKRGRGRPRKEASNEMTIENEENKDIDLFNIVEEPEVQNDDINLFEEIETPEIKEPEIDLFSIVEEPKVETPEIDLFDIEEEAAEDDSEIDLFNIDEETEENDSEIDLFNVEEEAVEDSEVDLINSQEEDLFDLNKQPEIQNNSAFDEQNNESDILNTNNRPTFNTNSIITSDKKVVAFVGTTKNGTSFIVNNTAEMLASIGIETAILDMTKSKNAYYMYTDNKENLREIAKNCMGKLENGIAEGIKVKKNLTVYTEMPGEETEFNISNVLDTLSKNYSLVIIDTDFDTVDEIFMNAQEIYLVQTMDVLTIQPLTAFLRNLKSKGILKPEKLKIVINKSLRVKGLNIKTLIAAMSCYNAPNMSYMTELFDRDNIKYCEIPFETQNYANYLNAIAMCSISLNGYTKQMISSLKELASIVYPLVNKQTYSPMNKKKHKDPFSNQVNDTLNKMKNKY